MFLRGVLLMEKNLYTKGRWRNCNVGFRLSEEEAKLLDELVELSGLAKQDYILTPGRYVGIEEQEEDGEPFEEKMARLTGELSELFAQSHTLEDEIRQKLEAIGYGL